MQKLSLKYYNPGLKIAFTPLLMIALPLCLPTNTNNAPLPASYAKSMTNSNWKTDFRQQGKIFV